MDTYNAIKDLQSRVSALEEKPHPGADPEVEGILADMDIVIQELKIQADEVREKLDAIAKNIEASEAPPEPFDPDTI